MRIVITGAGGDIGRMASAALADDHDLVQIDRRRNPGARNIRRADLSVHRLSDPFSPRSWLQRWPRYFKEADVVVHLAADRRPHASWSRVLRANIKATWHVLEMAAQCEVPRVVFASSNWAVKALQEELGNPSLEPDGPKIGSDAPPLPRAPYGISKGFGETVGRAFVDEGRIRSFIAVRIGHCPPGGRALVSNVYCRNHWIGIPDMQRLVRRCVEADYVGFHVVYGVSAQPESPYDLTYTKKLLGWEPEQSAEPLKLEPLV
jgi:nucleoside-diphosphate-sugar epimerase